MATWFSRPFDWDKDKDKDGRMTFAAGPDNSLTLTRKTGPIELRAFYDGLLVYRQKSTSPDTGSLELALFPDKWPTALQKHFNPDSAAKAVRSGFTELPPGRFVYQNIPRSKIEEKLNKIMLDSFLEWMRAHGEPHPSIEFIEGTDSELRTLKYRLEELWNKTPGDDTKKKEEVAKEITRILDLVFKQSADDPLWRALPVLGNDLLATLGDDRSPVVITFEIRNLYGEPLNPHFYLRKLEQNAGDLAPSPPFQSTDNSKDARLKDDPNKFLAIRIPKEGGAEFDLMPDPGHPYESPLIWTHTFNSTTDSHSTALAARPGQTPSKIPSIDPKAQTGVNVIWDNDNVTINKYAELFSCPCELIVASIHKEARPGSDNKGDLHSIRFEKIDKTVEFALDYEDLKEEAKNVDSPLIDDAVDAYWRHAGGWSTDPDSPAYELLKKDVAPAPKAEAATFPVAPTDNIGAGALTSRITWEQIEAIEKLKPRLITRRDMLLPPLGKKGAKTHYQFIVENTDLGTEAADVAVVYYKTVGGIGLVDGKEVPLKLAARTLNNYPLPFDKNKDVVVLTDGTKSIKWRQLLIVLNVLRSNGLTKAPLPAYVLHPLLTQKNFDFETRYIIPKLAELLGKTEPEAKVVFDNYSKLALAKKGLLFTDVGTPPVPGVKAESEPIPETVTLVETQEISKIFPGRISIGVGQVLFDTAARKIITWVRQQFTNKFFTDMGLVAPPGDVVGQIPWLWTNLWNNRELQIAFLAAYHKQNATVFWQPLNGKDADYRVGERMTMFDFPRQGACYNAGSIRKAEPGNDDTDWGLVTFGAYQTKYWSAVDAAIKKFDTFLRTDPKWARVRLRPDLETNSGMDAR